VKRRVAFLVLHLRDDALDQAEPAGDYLENMEYMVRLGGAWSEPAEWYEVRLAPHSRGYRQIAVGDATFLNGFVGSFVNLKPGLLGCAPNPFQGAFSVRFTLPALVDVQDVWFSLHDMQGKRVWCARVRGHLKAGVNQVFVRPEVGGGGLPSGVYILRVDMLSHNGQTFATFRTRTTSIR
jgi:hypothetical protein